MWFGAWFAPGLPVWEVPEIGIVLDRWLAGSVWAPRWTGEELRLVL